MSAAKDSGAIGAPKNLGGDAMQPYPPVIPGIDPNTGQKVPPNGTTPAGGTTGADRELVAAHKGENAGARREET